MQWKNFIQQDNGGKKYTCGTVQTRGLGHIKNLHRPTYIFGPCCDPYYIYLNMGAHLSSPQTEKNSSSGGDFNSDLTRFGQTAMQGWRVSMEDAHLAIPNLPIDLWEIKSISLYGVFDGHGGACVSNWISDHFPKIFKSQLDLLQHKYSNGQLKLKSQESISPPQALLAEVLQSSFIQVDVDLLKPEGEAELREINEKLRSLSENGLKSADIDSKNGSNLFKVFLPDGLNRHHTLQFLEQHLGRSTAAASDSTPNTYGAEESNDLYERSRTIDRVGTAGDSSTQGFSDPDYEDSDLSAEDESAGMDEMPDAHSSLPSSSMPSDFTYSDDGLAAGCGAATVVAVVVGGSNPSLIVANAGDSRAVLSRSGRAVPLTHDHKPHLPEEAQRIKLAGGAVTNGRVDGNLNLSRSLGDLAFKRDTCLQPHEQRISAFPDVRVCPLSSQDEFVIIACDGIWDCKTNQEAVNFVRDKISACVPLSSICEQLCDACLSRNPSENDGIGCDNMTCVIVDLAPGIKKGDPGTTVLYGWDSDPFINRELSDLSD